MSHLGVDIVDFLLLTIYPVVGLFVVEIISRAFKITSWVKLVIQGVLCIGFTIAYVTLIVAHWLTAIVLLALAVALLYQARIAKIKPGQSIY
ncbi:MAG TPA: hypothetical protein VLD38_02540 [Nitrosopumilaceae archaeon]|nr:hypothetical protein [Nitrosopumilaceae archaeon]